MASVLYKLSLLPRWRDIELIRSSVQTCCAPLLRDADQENAVAMVCAELLENTIKHGSGGKVDFSVGIDEQRNARIEVTNELASLRSARELADYLAWIASFNNPQEAYMARMQQIFDTGEVHDGGGLGLVRAAFEGNCQLSMETSLGELDDSIGDDEPLAIRIVGFIPATSQGEEA